MIASIQYTCKGTEAGDIYFHAASGYNIIDILNNGVSIPMEKDETYGLVVVPSTNKGDLVQIIYKTLPRNSSVSGGTSMVDFTDGDFETADFT
jgi:hypothetical protein